MVLMLSGINEKKMYFARESENSSGGVVRIVGEKIEIFSKIYSHALYLLCFRWVLEWKNFLGFGWLKNRNNVHESVSDLTNGF